MIYELDDISKQLFKSLKETEDDLSHTRTEIKYNRKCQASYTDMWLYFKSEGMYQADMFFTLKVKHERDVLTWERKERDLLERIKDVIEKTVGH